MSLITWNNSFSVGVGEIDKQHQLLIEIINELHGAMTAGKGKEVLSSTLKKLIDYTKTHFSFEEVLFKQFAYENTQDHVIEHEQFVKKVAEFNDGFSRGDSALSIEVLNFLISWLTNHIKNEDKRYASCFNEHGMN